MFKYKNIQQIRCGYEYCLFLDENGAVWSSGENIFGQLVIGKCDLKEYKLCKIEYFERNNIKILAIKCGSHHSLCIDSNHIVYAWGQNDKGQCGRGRTYQNISIPKTNSFLYE